MTAIWLLVAASGVIAAAYLFHRESRQLLQADRDLERARTRDYMTQNEEYYR